MLEIYLKYTDDNFYKLDINPSEGVNLKTIYKDLNDITKIFSPYTQSFKIPPTDKNKRLINFLGNEKTNNKIFEFDCKIYISGFLFQTGTITFDNFVYENGSLKEIKADFGSTLSGLASRIGDSSIQDVFINEDGNIDSNLKIKWNALSARGYFQNITSRQLANGIDVSFAVPFMSNSRVWLNDTDLNLIDNISFNHTRDNTKENFIKLSEIRPAITFGTIIKQLIKKYELNVICPILENPEVNDLYVYCNSENLIVTQENGFALKNFSGLTTIRYDFKNNNGDPPESPVYETTSNPTTGFFKIRKTTMQTVGWENGGAPIIYLKFNNLISLDGNATKIKVRLINTDNNIVIDSQTVEGANNYSYTFNDNGSRPLNYELNYKFEVLPETLCSWSNIETWNYQRFYTSTNYWGVIARSHAKYETRAFNYTASEDLGGDLLNLITSLPNIKAIDFLKSFFKMFNISVIPTGRDNNEMHWVTPKNILEQNKPYSKRIVDYTLFTDRNDLTKTKANKFNQYLFSHKKSKYFDGVYGDGSYFGNLIYPLTSPKNPKKFEVTTDFCVLKQSATVNFGDVRTCFAFQKEGATIQENGAVRYKSVFDDLTIFYLTPKNLNGQTIGFEYTTVNNFALDRVVEANFVNYNNGKSLAFGAENEIIDSLYFNYYRDFIERLFTAYESTFKLNLPSNEIFLNFSNQKQGESNIPTGFRPQNDIIIAEQRYSLIDSAIDLTNGETKLTLLNY